MNAKTATWTSGETIPLTLNHIPQQKTLGMTNHTLNLISAACLVLLVAERIINR